MRFLGFSVIALFSSVLAAAAAVHIDLPAFGASLGGWSKRDNRAAEYALSGAVYRTYKPEITPTPDNGIFVSLRIDHVRGWLSSDDHAVLEITISANGNIESAQSTLAIQGRAITTDLISSGSSAGTKLAGVDRAVQIGTDLVANLTSKMLREKLVEAGRVSYPSVLRHNYNLLFQAIRTEAAPSPETKPATDATPAPSPVTKPASGGAPAPSPETKPATDATPAPSPETKPATDAAPAPNPETKPAAPTPPQPPPKTAVKLEIKPIGEMPKSEAPAKK